MRFPWPHLFSEAIGTFILVLCGTGAIVVDHVTAGGITNLGIAITFGAVVMTLIYAFAPTSTAHFNPAVTIAFWANKQFASAKVVPYIVSQLTGAYLASITVEGLLAIDDQLGQTLPSGTWTQSFGLEVLLTFMLMLVIFKVTQNHPTNVLMVALAAGGVVGLEANFAGPICGASMNPARSFGPAIASGDLSFLWVYLIAPVAGALLAIPVHRITMPKDH